MKRAYLLLPLILLASVSCKKHSATEGLTKDTPSDTPPATGAGTATTEPSGADLSGSYTIKSASNPGGRGGYHGSAKLTKTKGYYDITWTITGSEGYAGVGLQDGSDLGVGWGQGGEFGVVVYKINGGKLDGSWTTHGASGVGVENIEGPASLSGTYKITKASTPAGKSYAGDVVITPKGDTYQVRWKLAGGDTYDGSAIREGDRLVVGWGRGGKGAGVVAYSVKGGELDGKWATPSGGALGTEVLAK